MRPIVETIEMAASPEKVFAALSNMAEHENLIEATIKMEVLTDGPVVVGARFRETRVMCNKEASEEMEITDFDPPHLYVTEAHSHGAHYISTWTVKPQGDGALVERKFEGRTKFLMSIWMVPMGLLLKRVMCKALRADLESIMLGVDSGAANQSETESACLI